MKIFYFLHHRVKMNSVPKNSVCWSPIRFLIFPGHKFRMSNFRPNTIGDISMPSHRSKIRVSLSATLVLGFIPLNDIFWLLNATFWHLKRQFFGVKYLPFKNPKLVFKYQFWQYKHQFLGVINALVCKLVICPKLAKTFVKLIEDNKTMI